MSCTNFLLKFNAQDFFFCSNLSKIIVNFVLTECRSSSSEVFLGKWGSEILQQIYRRTPMSKCDFNKIAKQHCNCKEIKLRHGCSPANLLCIFSTPFTFGGLLLRMMCLSSKFLLITCQSVPLYYMKV